MALRDHPVSRQQERIWTHARLLGTPHAYVLSAAFRFGKAVDVDRLRGAVDRVTGRHELLRSSFHVVDGAVRRRVASTVRGEVLSTDASSAEELLSRLLDTGFDIERAPLLRIGVAHPDDGGAILALAVHHLVADGWSIANLVHDLETEFERPGTLAAQSSDAFTRHVAREALGGQAVAAPAPVPVLPPASAGVVRVSRASSALARALRLVGERTDTSPTAALVAVAAAALASSTGLDRLVVGVPVAVRTAEEEGEVGPYFRVGRLEIAIDPDDDVRAFAERIDDALLDEIVDAHDPRRAEPAAGLVDLLVTDTAFASSTLRLGHPGTRIDVASPALEHPLALELSRTPGHERVVLDGDAAQFDPDDLARLLDRVEALTASVAGGELGPLRRLGALTAAEATSRRRTPPIPAEDRGGGTALGPRAVADHRVVLSREEAALRVERIAERLRRHGIGPGALVGVLVERSVDLPLTLLAIRATSAAYLPLSAAWPEDRRVAVLAHARPDLVVVSAPGEDTGLPVLSLTDGAEADAAVAGLHAPRRGDELIDAAYVVYTSGTTGVPKGVVVPNTALAAVIAAFQRLIPLDESDNFCAVSAVTFDIASLEMLWPAASGAGLVVASIEEPPTSQVTVLQCTPTVLLLLAADERWRRRLAELKVLILGGETVRAHHVRAARDLGGFDIYNAYGPSETTIWSALRRIADPETAELLGDPIPGTGFDVVDDWQRSVPCGHPGELLIDGDGVARGYLDDPDLTRRRFVRHDGRPAYLTGDRVLMTAEGSLRFLGRRDDQVKIHGYRIELAEVERAILSSGDVGDAGVVVADGALCAVLRWAGAPGDLDAVRDDVRRRLPSAAVPSRWVVVDVLPRSVAGKLDRRALAARIPRVTGPAAGRRATADDGLLVNICRAVAPAIDARAEVSFRAAGGESLTAVLVAIEARRRGWVVAAADLLGDAPLADVTLEPVAPSRPTPDGGIVGGDVAMSPMQRAFFARRRTSHDRANICEVFHLAPAVDLDRLQDALRRTFESHDAFRLRFTEDGGVWRQHLAAAARAPVLRLDADRGLDAPELRHVVERAQSVIGLRDGPVAGAAIISAPDGSDRIVALFASHAVVDATSLGLLRDDIEERYWGRTGAESSFAGHLRHLDELSRRDPAAALAPPSLGNRLSPAVASALNTVGAAREVSADVDAGPSATAARVLEAVIAAAAAAYARAGFYAFAVKLTESGREYAPDPSVIGWLSYDAYLDLPTLLGPDAGSIGDALRTARVAAARHRYAAPRLPGDVRPELNINVLAVPESRGLFAERIDLDTGAVDPREERGVDLRLRVVVGGTTVRVALQHVPAHFPELAADEFVRSAAAALAEVSEGPIP